MQKEAEIPQVQVNPGRERNSILIPKIEPNNTSGESFPEAKPVNLEARKCQSCLKISGLVLLLLFFFVTLSGLLFFRVYQKGVQFYASLRKVRAAVQAQNLPKIKSELQNSKSSLSELQGAYKSVSWMKVVPFFGLYISDGQHAINAGDYSIEAAEILIDTIEPYADIIGFTEGSQQAKTGQETTQDRIDFVIKTIPEVIPKAGLLAEKAIAVKNEIDYIEADRYPKSFAGYELRNYIERGKELVELGTQLIANGKPLLEEAPYLLGAEEPRTYLILFQNDKELRPTGGFITAYSIAKVEKGKFEPISSDDIYNLDGRYNPRVKAAEPVIKYLKGPYTISKNYRLRDLNWSPDFKESMSLFVEEIERVGIDDIDGVIAVDTQALVYIMEVLGEFGVPGYGNFSTKIVPECGCPQVIYELESFADIEGPVVWSQDEPGKIIYAPPNYDNRKKIIGPLMNSILANALGQPKDKLPALFEATFKSLMEKHVLFYVLQEDAQDALVNFGVGGTVDRDYEGDFLHINDANLGGRKSNLYVSQEVVQEIEVAKDGGVEKVITITYKNPERHDGWLNSVLPNWVRIYVPKGSELIAFDGVEDKVEPYEEFGKTVFAGFFELRPEGVAKVTVKYKLPFKVDAEYKLYLQKQAGTDAPLYVITLGKQEEEFFLRVDKELRYSL